MSNNCLVTTLKSAVNNSNLEKLGVARLYGNATLYCKILADEAQKSILKNISNVTPYSTISGDIIDSTSRYIPTASGVLTYTAVDNGKLMEFDVIDKYHLTHIENFGIEKFRDFAYSPIDYINSKIYRELNISFYLDEFQDYNDKSILTYFNFAGIGGTNALLGSLSVFNNFPNLTYLVVNYYYETFTISELSGCTKLTTLGIANCPEITGSLDELATALAPSRGSDTLAFTGNGKVTYKVGGVDTVIANSSTKTITFNGSGGYTIS